MNKSLKEYTWQEHLQSLRNKIIIIVIFFFISLLIGVFLAKPIFNILRESPFVPNNINWNVFNPSDVFGVYLKFSFIFALFISIPIAIYNIIRYISPGLYKEEITKLYYILFGSVFLTVAGICFTYYVILPSTFSFITYLNQDLGFNETYGVNQFFSFVFNVTLAITIIFQFPLIIVLLTSLGLINPYQLVKLRKHAYFTLLFVSCVVTPPDPIMDALVAIPLFSLYEVSLLISKVVYKRHFNKKKKYIESIKEVID